MSRIHKDNLCLPKAELLQKGSGLRFHGIGGWNCGCRLEPQQPFFSVHNGCSTKNQLRMKQSVQLLFCLRSSSVCTTYLNLKGLGAS